MILLMESRCFVILVLFVVLVDVLVMVNVMEMESGLLFFLPLFCFLYFSSLIN